MVSLFKKQIRAARTNEAQAAVGVAHGNPVDNAVAVKGDNAAVAKGGNATATGDGVAGSGSGLTVGSGNGLVTDRDGGTAAAAATTGSVQPDSRGSLIRIDGVGKIFDAFDGGKTEALRQTSLTIEPGEFVALVGPSGCGKSTLLRIVSGLLEATGGSVFIDGQIVNGTNPHVGFVFQDPNLFPWLTVRNNIGFGPGLKVGRRHLPEEVDDLIRRVGLESFANALPHHLSGGMAQRAALARALVNRPSLLLLDEPLGALDAFTRMAMQDELRSLVRTRGTTVLLVTHDIDEALYLSDRVLIMAPRPGRIEGEIRLGPHFPRVRNAPEFNEYRGQILETLHFAPTPPEDLGPNI